MNKTKAVAAIIISDNKVFATQRGYGEYKDGWEFPGGKVELGETSEEALEREIWEELDTVISVGQQFETIEYDYPKFYLSMDCFICRVISGDLALKEHKDARWLTADVLESVDWLPADRLLISKLKNYLQTE